jgi:adenylate cyclase
MAHLLSRRFDQAVPQLLLAIQDQPRLAQAYRILAACHAHMGRLDEARAVIERLRAITPVVIADNIPLRNPEHRELFLSGLRMAAGAAT